MENLAQLFRLYTNGKADSLQESAFLELASRPENQQELEDIIRDLLREVSGIPMPEASVQATLQAIFQAVPATPVVPLQKRKRYWPQIAAAILLLIATGAYFLYNSHQKQSSIATAPAAPRYDLAPGGNKAVLTLASGQKIILDSTRNGTLAKQGNANIVKTDSGKLVYTISPEKPAEIVYNTLTTPRGGQYQLLLPDGTRVWLNAASSITYPTAFAGHERKVEITGEAYFEVAHNPDKPFHVKVNDMEIEVLGTHFNINAYTDETTVKTTLLEGSVKILSTVNRQLSTVLKPGQQAQLTKNGEINVADNADTEQAVAWKNGLFKFKQTNIREIMRQVSRWYDVEVEFSGNVNDLNFGGVVSKQAYVSELLKLLETTGTVHFTVADNKIIVRP
jgi:ferric-dicitrate binding protein FerR (iron transport regulator)